MPELLIAIGVAILIVQFTMLFVFLITHELMVLQILGYVLGFVTSIALVWVGVVLGG